MAVAVAYGAAQALWSVGALSAAIWVTSPAGILAIKLATTSALAIGAAALQRAKRAPEPGQLGASIPSTTEGSTRPQSIVFGRTAVAGNMVAPAMSHGISGTKAKGRHRYMTMVLDLADHPIDGYEGLYIDNEFVTFGALSGGNEAYLGPTASGDFANKMWLSTSKDGRQTSSDSFLRNIYGDDLAEPYPERPWLSDMVLRGVPYVAITHKFSPNTYGNRYPTHRHRIRGARLYDWRKDSTQGGSGTHRLNDPDTWQFTSNPIVQAAALVIGFPMPDGEVYGLDLGLEGLDLSAATAAANICDEPRGGAARYQCALEFSVADEPLAVIEEILKTCAGDVLEDAGIFFFRAGPPAASVLTITDDDLMDEQPYEFDPLRGYGEKSNGAVVLFTAEDNEYQQRPASTYKSATYVTEDGQEFIAQVDLRGVTRERQANELARTMVEDSRRARAFVLPLTTRCAALRPLQTITWASDRYGVTKTYEVRRVRVDARTLRPLVALREVDPSDWNEDAFDADTNPPASKVPVIFPAEGLEAFSAVGAQFAGDGGRAASVGAILSWDADTTAGGGIEFEIRRADGQQVVVRGTLQDRVASGAPVRGGMVPATAYEARARDTAGAGAAWTAWVPFTTPAVSLSFADFSQSVADTINDAAAAADAAQAAANAASDAAQAVQDDLDAQTAALAGTIADEIQAVEDGYKAADNALKAEVELILADLDTANAIRTASGTGDTVGNWTALSGASAPTFSSDVPAGQSGKSIVVSAGGAKETPYYDDNQRAFVRRRRGWVKITGGGIGYAAIVGSLTGQGPEAETVLAQSVGITSGQWQRVDLEYPVVDQEVLDWAPAWIVTGGTLLFFEARDDDYSGTARALALVAENTQAIADETSARILADSQITSAYQAADVAAKADVLSQVYTRASVDGALAQQRERLEAAFSNNLISTPTPSGVGSTDEQFGYWLTEYNPGAGRYWLSGDVPAGSPAGAKSFVLREAMVCGPRRYGSILGRKVRLIAKMRLADDAGHSWSQAGNTAQLCIRGRAKGGVNDRQIVSSLAPTGERCASGVWATYTWTLTGTVDTDFWYPAVDVGGANTAAVRVLALDMFALDVTDPEAAEVYAQALAEDITSLSAVPGTALGNRLNSIEATAGDANSKATINQTALATIEGKQAASVVLRAQAGNKASVIDLVAADDPTGPGVEVVKVRARDIVLKGSVGMEELTVGLGTNLIDNAMPGKYGTRGWVMIAEGGPDQLVITKGPDNWGHPHGVFRVGAAGTAPNDSVRLGFFGFNEDTPDGAYSSDPIDLIAVEPGKIMQVSAGNTTHRCRIRPAIRWQNAAGAFIGWTYGAWVDAGVQNRNNPVLWPRYGVTAVVPAGAAHMMPFWFKERTRSGETSSYAFIFRPQVVETTQEALDDGVLEPYSHPLSLYVGGGGIFTPEVAAKTVTATNVKAAAGQFGTLSAFGLDADTASFRNLSVTTAKIAGRAVSTAPRRLSITNNPGGGGIGTVNKEMFYQFINYDAETTVQFDVRANIAFFDTTPGWARFGLYAAFDLPAKPGLASADWNLIDQVQVVTSPRYGDPHNGFIWLRGLKTVQQNLRLQCRITKFGNSPTATYTAFPSVWLAEAKK